MHTPSAAALNAPESHDTQGEAPLKARLQASRQGEQGKATLAGQRGQRAHSWLLLMGTLLLHGLALRGAVAAPNPPTPVSPSPGVTQAAPPSSASTEANPWAQAPGSKEYPKASSLLLRDLIEVQVQPDGSHDLVEFDAIRLLDRESYERFGKVIRSYDDRLASVEVQQARLWMPDGHKIDLPASQITDTIARQYQGHPLYGHMHVLVLDYKQAVPGAVIEYRLRHHRRNIWAGNRVWESSFTQDVTPMLDTTFSLTAPVGQTFNVATPGTPGLVPVSTSQAMGLITREWHMTQRPPYKREPLMPAVRDVASQIQASNFASWDDFAGWASSLYDQVSAPDEGMRTQARSIIGKESQPDKQVAAVLAWMAEQKPVFDSETGLDELLPTPATQSATSKATLLAQDRAVLLLGMLRACGLKAHLALVSSAEHGDPLRGVPSLGQFDRLMVVYEQAGSLRWVDPAAHSVDNPGPGLQQRPALLLDAQGKGRFVVTPLAPAHTNRELIQGISRVDPDGSMDTTLQYREYGNNAASWRRLTATADKDDVRQVLAMMVNGINPNASLRDFNVHAGVGQEPCVVTMGFELPNAATYSVRNKCYQMALPLMTPRRLLSYIETPVNERTHPVCLATPTYEEQHLEIVIPEGWKLKSAAAPEGLHNAAGSLDAHLRVQGRHLYYTTRIILRQPVYDVKTYGDFRNLILRLGQVSLSRLEFEGPAPATPPAASQGAGKGTEHDKP